jgi:hypothetical protein
MKMSRFSVSGTGNDPYIPPPPPTYVQKVVALAPSSLIRYLTYADTSGTTAADSSGNNRAGAYVGGVTLNQTGIGDGGTGVLLDGTTGYVNAFSAGEAGAINMNTLSILIWIRVLNAGVWTNTLDQYFCDVFVDTNNRIGILKINTNNTVEWFRVSAGVLTTSNIGSISTTGWLMLGLVVSGGIATPYVAGSSGGTLLAAPIVGSVTKDIAGAKAVDQSGKWNGYLAHYAIWNTALSAANMSALAVVP